MADGPAGSALIPAREGLEFFVSKRSPPSTNTVLSSKWTGLSPHLLATIYPVTPEGARDTGPDVVSPPTDGTMEMTANWHSPFEASGAETKAPAIMAMLQSGVLSSYSQPLEKIQGSGTVGQLIAGVIRGGAQSVREFGQAAQGRSAMTKLNSTQVFSGATPLKLPMTLHFRAFSDPASEVQAPVDQLWAWFLARKLETNGTIVAAGKAISRGDWISAILPSEAPQLVGLRFGGSTFAPLVIESLSQPFTVSRGIDGQALQVAISVVLASLTALDQGDWRRAREGKPTALFNNA